MIGANGVETDDSTLVSVPENLPKSLALNQWHNVAIEILCDGTNKTNIYIDGVKYECGTDLDMYGVYRYRLNIVSGSMYIDNYRCLEAEQADEIYPISDYQMEDVIFNDFEKAELNEDGKINILDASLTAGEIKAAIVNEGVNVAVFSDATYKTALADDEVVAQGAVVVTSNGKGAFRYLDFDRVNDSIFEIKEIGDGIGCKVLG